MSRNTLAPGFGAPEIKGGGAHGVELWLLGFKLVGSWETFRSFSNLNSKLSRS